MTCAPHCATHSKPASARPVRRWFAGGIPGSATQAGYMRGLTVLALGLLLSGCYRWTQVPDGLQQKPIDLPVSGLVQRYTEISPKPAPVAVAAAKKPAVLLLHSGFSGDEPVTADLGRALAQRGLVVLLPAYRGQLRRVDGKRSEGQIEFCKGEVDDAAAGLAWLQQQPEVDASRIAVMGLSHGGCIALRLGQQAPWLRAIVTLSAPVSIGPLIEHLEATRFQTFFYNGILASQLKGYAQTRPELQQEAYADRSALPQVTRLAMPLLIIHGTADRLVPLKQACWLWAALRGAGRPGQDRLLARDGTTQALTQPVCQNDSPPSTDQSGGPAVDFIFMQGQDHLYSSTARGAVHQLSIEYLLRRLAP